MPQTPQTYANHVRHRPLFWTVYLVFLVDLGWSAYRAVLAPSTDTILAVLTATALVLLAVYARVFALTVQDRVIRLEMRLRLRELLPAALHPRIADFTTRQLVALRFAGDAELPALAEKVLRDNVRDSKAIKQMVREWQGDYLRA
jgi:hypothetical protein